MRRALACALLAICAVPGTAHGRTRVAPDRTSVVVRTVPAIEGVAIRVAGRTVRTDRRGRARLRVHVYKRPPVAKVDKYWRLDDTAAILRPHVRGRSLPGGGRAVFERFYGEGRIAMSTRFPFRPQFLDPEGEAVDPALIEGYRLKARTGTVIEVAGGKPAMLQASRVVPFRGVLVAKAIEWSVEEVRVGGANVVNRSQQRFLPRKLHGRRYPIDLLFFRARFTSRDAIFGFHVGDAIELTYPNGEVQRHEFDKDGEVVLRALPRGEYTVRAKAGGISPPRPVALSRVQEVDLKVISWLDLALGGSALACTALFLLVARRPHLRRLPRRREAR